MRVALACGSVLVLLATTAPAGAGEVVEACRGGETDENAVAIDDEPKARLEYEARRGGFYFTPSGTPSEPHTWRETNLDADDRGTRGLQRTARTCSVYDRDGASWTLLSTYTVPADTPVRGPEQAVP